MDVKIIVFIVFLDYVSMDKILFFSTMEDTCFYSCVSMMDSRYVQCVGGHYISISMY